MRQKAPLLPPLSYLWQSWEVKKYKYISRFFFSLSSSIFLPTSEHKYLNNPSSHFQNRLVTLVWCIWGELWIIFYFPSSHATFQTSRDSAYHTGQMLQDEMMQEDRSRHRGRLERGEKACWCLVSAEIFLSSHFVAAWTLYQLKCDVLGSNYLCGAFRNSWDKS